MQPLKRRRDPAPSMLRYRLGRLWLTPAFQRALRIGPLLVLVGGLITYGVTDRDLRAAVTDSIAQLRDSIADRDEFRVAALQIRGAGAALSDQVTGLAAAHLPASSLDLEIIALRREIEALPAVSHAAVRVAPGGVLEIDLRERMPTLLWRHAGALHVLDADGVNLGTVPSRMDRADLPLILGAGAGDHVGQALDLLVAAAPVAHRIRGLQRVADRRWNLLLDRDQTIMLPQANPTAALRRVIGLHQVDDILERDITVVDMRNGHRPVLRLGRFAQSELRRIRGLDDTAEEGASQ